MAAAKLVWIGGVSTHETDVNYAGNWDSRTNGESDRVPIAGDSIVFNSEATYNCSAGLDTLAAVALASVTVEQTFTKTIGDGGTGYLQFLCSGLVEIGKYSGSGSPAGSSNIQIDVGTTATDIIVCNTGTSSTNLPAVKIKANSASTDISVRKGSVGVAVLPGETSTIGTLDISYVSNQSNDANVVCGSGVTLSTVDKIGGVAYLNSAATTVTQSAGTLYIAGSGALTTLTIEGGTAYPESTGTITTLNCKGGVTDMSRSRTARTVTTTTLYSGATLIADSSIVTFTNKITTPAGIVKITGA